MEIRKKILVVDDEPDIAKTISVMLSLEGYEVMSATSGEDAMEIIRINKPDLLMLDVILPGISGKEISAALKKDNRYQKIPIILITAQTQKNEIEILEKLPANLCITKPFEPSFLINKIKELLKLQETNNK